jgi:hypothetical protein
VRRAVPALALLLVSVACGEAGDRAGSSAPSPISGAQIDAMRAEVRANLERDPGFVPAERLRIERAEDGARIVVHVTLPVEVDEQGYAGLCETIAEAGASVLVEGQSQEVYFVKGDAIVHSCAP